MTYLEGKYTAAKYGSCMVARYEELINNGYDPQEALSELNIILVIVPNKLIKN